MIQGRNARRLLLLCAVCLAGAGPAAGGERFERTVVFEETLATGATFKVENLLGSITVKGGVDHRTARVEAQIVAEAKTEEDARQLAESVRLLQRTEGSGIKIHVAFPVERHTSFRLPRSEKDGLVAKWVTPVVQRNTVSVEYDGRTVEVSPGRGAAALAVNLTVALPVDVDSHFRQIAGSIHTRTSRGTMNVEVVEGKVFADHLYGELRARSGGGPVTVTSFTGDKLNVQTGSGDVELMEIHTENAHLTTDSGRIEASSVTSGALKVETTSGDVELTKVEPIRLEIFTDSGKVDLSSGFQRTREASIRSSTGDVTLRVGELCYFTVVARTESGEVKTRGVDLDLLEPQDGKARLRKGKGGPELHVSTEGGALTVKAL